MLVAHTHKGTLCQRSATYLKTDLPTKQVNLPQIHFTSQENTVKVGCNTGQLYGACEIPICNMKAAKRYGVTPTSHTPIFSSARKQKYKSHNINRNSESVHSGRLCRACARVWRWMNLCVDTVGYMYLEDQRTAVLSSLVLLPSHSTCFRCLPHPSSGVHKLQLQPLVQVMNLEM